MRTIVLTAAMFRCPCYVPGTALRVLQIVCPLILLAIGRNTKARKVKPHAIGHLAGNLIGKITLLSLGFKLPLTVRLPYARHRECVTLKPPHELRRKLRPEDRKW